MFAGADEVQWVIKAGVKWRGEAGDGRKPFQTLQADGEQKGTS